jgi:hypothetical protein
MKFNEFIGYENLYKEYKEFTLNLAGLPLDIDTCNIYCKTNKFDFNNIVIDNLKKYFEVYLPKYISSFLNLSTCHISNFMIGINDFGYVKGIPYKGDLPINELSQIMYNIINNNINCDNILNLNNFIKINFIKVIFNKNDNNSIHPKYNEYLIYRKKYNLEYEKYLLEYNIWKKKYIFINKKLIDLINTYDTRTLIINYIKSLDPNNIVIDLLLSNYKFKPLTHFQIIEAKKNINNPYYWITRWKDEYKNYIISLKPKFNMKFLLKNIPYILIQSISSMIPYWMNNNDNMNLYVIKIDIIKINQLNKYKFKYYNYITQKWFYCKREIINNQPTCIIIK